MNSIEENVVLLFQNMDCDSIIQRINESQYIKIPEEVRQVSELQKRLFVVWYDWKFIRRLQGQYCITFDNIQREKNNDEAKARTVLIIKINLKLVKNLKSVGIDVPTDFKYLKLYIGKHVSGEKLTNSIIETFFNYNSLHLMINGVTIRYKKYNEKLIFFKSQINKYGFDANDFVIVSSGILGLYGMREPTDIDMVTLEPNYKMLCDSLIDCHHHVLDTYEITAEELVSNPFRYVYWNGLKFAAIDVIYRACCNRVEATKKIDGYFANIIKGEVQPSIYDLTRKRVQHYYLRTVREWQKKHLAYYEKKNEAKNVLKSIIMIPYWGIKKIVEVMRNRNETHKD